MTTASFYDDPVDARVVDIDDQPIGVVQATCPDPDRPASRWLIVSAGPLGPRRRAVPAVHVTWLDSHTVRFSRARRLVDAAPAAPERISAVQARELRAHYDLQAPSPSRRLLVL